MRVCVDAADTCVWAAFVPPAARGPKLVSETFQESIGRKRPPWSRRGAALAAHVNPVNRNLCPDR